MAHLTFAGASDDGKRLLLVDDQGVEHTIDVTPRLRAALRDPQPQGPRPGRTEKTTMDSALRPRDIQTRIRAGETPEAVAEAARTDLAKIMPFVAPVLAERAHVAEKAQRSTLRRRPGADGAPASASRVLGDAVAAHLRSVNVDPETVEWDAWRREDGRWSLRASFAAGARAGMAEYTFDLPGNYVLLDNDDARWLVGDPLLPAANPATPADQLEPARTLRRLNAVPSQQVADDLGVDAIELVAEPEPLPDPVPAAADVPLDVQMPLEAFLDDDPDSDDTAIREEAADAAAADPDPAPEPPARRPVSKKKGRASVPSWDEIMFGGSDQ